MEVVVALLCTFCSVLAMMKTTKNVFDVTPVNVTVTAGETAILPCTVEKLRENNTIIWMNPNSILISNEDRRIIDNMRISVERPYTKDWNLHIREVRYSDKGQYTCQINTKPVRIKRVFLDIQVPSKIIEELSSKDMNIEEGSSVDVVCNVTGIPEPSVMWFRKTKYLPPDGENLQSKGSILELRNVTRYDEGTYQCLAYNGVAPAATKDIHIGVLYPPEIKLRNTRLGQDLGRETILECLVTAGPQGTIMWHRDGKALPTNSWKYRTELYEENLDTDTLSLRIRNLDRSDYGHYTCKASNILGEDEKRMELYEYHTITTRLVTTPNLEKDNNVIVGPIHGPDDPNFRSSSDRVKAEFPLEGAIGTQPGKHPRGYTYRTPIPGTYFGNSGGKLRRGTPINIVLAIILYSAFSR